jgi:hypothetical protein
MFVLVVGVVGFLASFLLFGIFFLYFGVSYSSLESVFLVWSQFQASYFGVSYFSLESVGISYLLVCYYFGVSYLSMESVILVWSDILVWS